MVERLKACLENLLMTHAPTGCEAEMDRAVSRHFEDLGLTPRQDRHGNVWVRIRGPEPGPPVAVTAHKDELAHIVRKIDDDGNVWVEALGGSRPQKYGEGPFDILTDNGVVPAVLCLGSTHSSSLSSRTHAATRNMPQWDVVCLDCGLDRDGVRDAGVRIGDRALPGRARKQPFYLGEDIVCGYGIDDKAGVAVLILLAEALVKEPPGQDVVLAATSCEESGCSGAAFLCRSLEVDDIIALEVAPIAEEYPVMFDARPVLMYKDSLYHYHLGFTRELERRAAAAGIECQAQVVRSFGSDAAMSSKYGVVGRGACMGFPTKNTHGFEMIRLGALEQGVRALTAALREPFRMTGRHGMSGTMVE